MNPTIPFPSPTCQPASRIRVRTCRTAHPGRSSTGLAAQPTSSRFQSTRVAAAMVSGGDTLNKGIAEMYDKSSGAWENIWGDHMHHGFYDPHSDVSGSLSDHRAAQIRMIEEALQFSGVSEVPKRWPKNVVDVGCGIGGSSRYIAMKYGAKCWGITLSPVQAQRANALAVAEGLADKVSFQVADALEQPFPDGQFDLVWSMESGEHMPDKRKFVSELTRVAAPGATIIIVTWCHRDLGPSEESLQTWEKEHLRKICNSYYLPEWCSAADYVKLLQSLSLQVSFPFNITVDIKARRIMARLWQFQYNIGNH
uniref:Methyltransferase type 11 domain-containing protein n=1 Tax=Rhizophora mucronata TaxID=61149 RepID=A0A2P2J8I1_RHIMU